MEIKKILGNKSILIGGGIFVLIVICAVFAPLITKYAPTEIDVNRMLQTPSAAHLFGTDAYGRDIFSRVVYGARVSLIISISVAAFSGVIGCVIGMFAGYYKKAESIIMCIMDGLMALPSLLLAMAIVAVLGNGMFNMILALTISNIPRIVRTVRATVISVKNLDYVEAARSMGASDARIMWRYIFPECISPLIVRLTMTMAFTILEEASLTFLGLGLSPETPCWGIILSEAKKYIRTSPYFLLIPGAVVVAVVYGINTLGDGLRDLLDPKLNK